MNKMKNLSESIMKNLKESADNSRIVTVENVSRNSRRLNKNVNVRRIKESENLTARVTYHSEDGTRDYIAGRLSDGRYFLIGQQEQIVVSDKDLPRLAKKDMDDFRYDEDGDKEFIEALENGTTLDKNSDLAKIIINASRKHLDDGCYLLSESVRRIKENKNLIIKSRRKAKKLNEDKVVIENNGQFDVAYGKLYYALSFDGVTIYNKDVYKFINTYEEKDEDDDFITAFDEFDEKHIVAMFDSDDSIYEEIVKRDNISV